MKKKTEIIKSYLFIWKFDIGDLPLNKASEYLEGCKKSIPAEYFEDCLNAQVLSLYLAKQNSGPTELQIYEFFLDSKTPYSVFNKEINNSEDKINMLEEIVKKLKDGTIV